MIYDSHGRQIERGDVLKVFHFVGRRNKKHYMFQQALGIKTMRDGTDYMMISYLDLNDKYYVECCDGRHLANYEIVQSIDARFEDRDRHTPAVTPGDAP